MKTKNIYNIPIDLSKVTKFANVGIARVGDLVNSIDYDAPEGVPIFAALDCTVTDLKDNSKSGGKDQKFENDGNYIEILHANDEVSEYEHIRFHSAKVKV